MEYLKLLLILLRKKTMEQVNKICGIATPFREKLAIAKSLIQGDTVDRLSLATALIEAIITTDAKWYVSCFPQKPRHICYRDGCVCHAVSLMLEHDLVHLVPKRVGYYAKILSSEQRKRSGICMTDVTEAMAAANMYAYMRIAANKHFQCALTDTPTSPQATASVIVHFTKTPRLVAG